MRPSHALDTSFPCQQFINFLLNTQLAELEAIRQPVRSHRTPPWVPGMIPFTHRASLVLQLLPFYLVILGQSIGGLVLGTFLEGIGLGIPWIRFLGLMLLFPCIQGPRRIVVDQESLYWQKLCEGVPQLNCCHLVIFSSLLSLLLPFKGKILLIFGRKELNTMTDGMQIIGNLLYLVNGS